MPAARTVTKDRHNDLRIFDEIIRRAFAEFCEADQVNIKMGEFVMKAIKQKADHTPQGSDQKEFWKMIEQIRKKSLAENRATKGTKSKPRKQVSAEQAKKK